MPKNNSWLGASALLGLLWITTAPIKAQPAGFQTKSGADPCTAKSNFEKATADLNAAGERYNKIEEPDWHDLPVGYRPPGSFSSNRDEKLKGLYAKLTKDLRNARAAAGTLTPEQAKAKVDAAIYRQTLLDKQWQQKQDNLKVARDSVAQLEAELKALATAVGPPDANKQQRIKQYRKTIQDDERKVQLLVGIDEVGPEEVNIMDTVRNRLIQKNYQGFSNANIKQKKQVLDQAQDKYGFTSPEAKKASDEVKTAIDAARQEARDILAARDAAEKELDRLGGKESEEQTQQKAQKEAELKQTQAKLKSLENQRPTQTDLAAADVAVRQAQKSVDSLGKIDELKGAIQKVEPWINARLARSEAEDNLKAAQDEYSYAIKAKDALVEKCQNKLQDEQGRMGRVTASLQGATKDGAYYQKLSQTTLHARATYELLLINLSDFDCYPDVRSFMDDIKARMNRLDAARDKLLQQASTVTKPKQPPVRIAKPIKPQKPAVVKVEAPMWICDGPTFEKKSRFEVKGTSASFTYQYDGREGKGEITWSGIPLTIREGETVTLKMDCTGEAPASATGWFAFNCDGEHGKEWDNTAVSIPSNDRSSPTPSAHMVFKFAPRSDKPYIQVVAAMNEGYIQDVFWNYRKK